MRAVVSICALALLPVLIGAQTRFARNDAATEPVDFTGYKVIRMKPANVDQAAMLRHLEGDYEVGVYRTKEKL